MSDWLRFFVAPVDLSMTTMTTMASGVPWLVLLAVGLLLLGFLAEQETNASPQGPVALIDHPGVLNGMKKKTFKKTRIIEKLYRIWIVQLISEEYTSFLLDNMNILYWKEHILKWIEKNMSDHSWSFLNSKHHAWSNPQNDQVEKCVATRLPLVKTVTFHGWAGLWYPFLLISNTHRGPRGAFNVH